MMQVDKLNARRSGAAWWSVLLEGPLFEFASRDYSMIVWGSSHSPKTCGHVN